MTSKVNGWTNYETWVVNLWMDEYTRGVTPDFAKEDEVKEFVEGVMIGEHQLTGLNGLASDLLTHSLGNVNYQELFEHYKEEKEYD